MSTLRANTIKPITSGNSLVLQGDSGGSGVTGLQIDSSGDLLFTNAIKTDDIIEKTTDHGVEIDGVLLKDGDVGVTTISSKAGTSIGVTLGTDAGDDFNVGSGKLVVEGDSGKVGIGTTSPGGLLHVYSNASGVNNYINISSATNAQSGLKLLQDATRAWEIANGSDNILRILDADISQGVSISQNATSWSAASDERQKTDWNNFENALNKINSLTKIGTYKSIDPVTQQYINIDATQVGVSGQEVEKILPEAVNKMKRHPDFNDDNLYIQLEYQALFVLALKAIQELSAKVTALENA